MRHLQVVTAVCLLLLPVALRGQGLGAAAAREKAKRDKAAGKAPAPSYSNESLKRDASASTGAATGSQPQEAQSTATSGQTTAAATVAPQDDDLPFCPGGQEMLLAWSAAHSAFGKDCEGGPQAGTTGRFDMKLTLSASGVVEAATVTPENAYTTCLAGRMRGHVLVAPSNGKRCRTAYEAMWRL